MNIADDPSLNAEAIAARLTHRYRPGAWIAGVRKAFGPLSEAEDAADDAALEAHPAHYLAALWRPPYLGMPLLPRWPFKVVLVAPDAGAAVRDLLDEVPAVDRLWLTDQHVDWVLMARIVALTELGLQPWQRAGLQALLRAEDQATLAAIRLNYAPDDATTAPRLVAGG
jgi:hypothetical protein